MQFSARLTGEAAALARQHEAVLRRLPGTLHAFVVLELQKWSTLFAAEHRYQRALLEGLGQMPAADLLQALAGISRIEGEAGCSRIARADPAQFQDEAQALLRKHRLLAAWRQEVDAFFRTINPALEARLYPADAPRRLVVVLYGDGIAIQPAGIWRRFTGAGVRVPLHLAGAPRADGFLRALFAIDEAAHGSAVLRAGAAAPTDTWIIESHDALYRLCADMPIAGLSYDRLRAYRDELTRALYSKIQSGVESPQAFAAYARRLTIAPAAGSLLHADEPLQAFVRDVFLAGNGTLFVNNTFVEWAAVQALRRAQPRILVARFGVRDRLKPFSSLLLFSQPRPSDQIPLIEDPVGSFIDVEHLSYYIWLNAEKSAAYRNRTLYLFLAEGFDEMLAIRSHSPVAAPAAPPATLPDVCATMAQWLGAPFDHLQGRPIPALVG